MNLMTFNNILLVSSGLVQYSRPPAAVAFLSGVCEGLNLNYQPFDINYQILQQCGHEVWFSMNALNNVPWDQWPAQLQVTRDQALDHMISLVLEKQPDLIAMTVLSHLQHLWTEKFLVKIKQHLPNCVVIIGGPGVSIAALQSTEVFYGRWLADQDLVDYFVYGEGEIIFPEFLKGNKNLPGLNHKNLPNDQWQPQIDNLDNFDFPSYKKISTENYTGPDGKPRIIITGSKGCVRSCSFCDVQHFWKKYRYRSGKNIAKEILHHYQTTGATDYWFNDSLINGSLKNFNELLTHLIEFKKTTPGLNGMTASGQFIIRPKNSHPESLYQSMASAGIQRLEIGVESGSVDVRKHMGKNFSNEDINWHLEMCEKYKIHNVLLLIVGYPTETINDFDATIDMLKRYQKYTLNDTIINVNLQSPLVVLPNTPLWEHRTQMDVNNIDDYENWYNLNNPELTFKERIKRLFKAADIMLELGYSMSMEFAYSYEKYYQQLQNNKTKQMLIPIKLSV